MEEKEKMRSRSKRTKRSRNKPLRPKPKATTTLISPLAVADLEEHAYLSRTSSDRGYGPWYARSSRKILLIFWICDDQQVDRSCQLLSALG